MLGIGLPAARFGLPDGFDERRTADIRSCIEIGIPVESCRRGRFGHTSVPAGALSYLFHFFGGKLNLGE